MIDVMKLCTCDNPECENNPRRCADACDTQAGGHELSCTSCVATNLECNSLPRCFFHKLGFKSEEINTWTFEIRYEGHGVHSAGEGAGLRAGIFRLLLQPFSIPT